MFEFEPICETDLPFLIEVRNECRDNLHDNREFTLDNCQAWFRVQKPDFFIIRLCGERIGYFRLSNYLPDEASIYVGADIHREFRGRGYARRAYAEFFSFLRERYCITTVKLEVLSHNTIAHALYLKLGFVEIYRKRVFAVRNGVSIDSIVMALKLNQAGGVCP